jgi:hypothetical protein
MGKRRWQLHCPVVGVVLAFGWLASGSPPPQAGAAPAAGAKAPPVPTLYRILFRHVNALEAAASDLDSKKQEGGDGLRSHYQKQLNLSDSETAVLKSTAADCGRQLDAQEARALAAIKSTRAKDSAGTPAGKAPVPSTSTKAVLASLEQERADISTGCAKSFQAGVAAQTAAAFDVYVRTVIASDTTAKAPAITVPTQPLSQTQKGGN